MKSFSIQCVDLRVHHRRDGRRARDVSEQRDLSEVVAGLRRDARVPRRYLEFALGDDVEGSPASFARMTVSPAATDNGTSAVASCSFAARDSGANIGTRSIIASWPVGHGAARSIATVGSTPGA